jgi:hypothetical protein
MMSCCVVTQFTPDLGKRIDAEVQRQGGLGKVHSVLFTLIAGYQGSSQIAQGA